MPEDKEGGFKVTDRRLFNPDGSLREDAQAQDVSAENSHQAQFTEEPAFTPDLSDSDLQEIPEQTVFTEFLMGVASSAFIYLGLVEHPATGRRQVDLNAAKESIDMLVMLRNKTKGNLTRGEEKFFEDLLSDLRMQFVSMKR
ncbi:MAG: DUF1844 domain-containing protein [Acidobacteria bacterium]|nr:DUF1844 domain-containing protein [Acidobacteriota bacterium]